jgi:hypothetical protein
MHGGGKWIALAGGFAGIALLLVACWPVGLGWIERAACALVGLALLALAWSQLARSGKPRVRTANPSILKFENADFEVSAVVGTTKVDGKRALNLNGTSEGSKKSVHTTGQALVNGHVPASSEPAYPSRYRFRFQDEAIYFHHPDNPSSLAILPLYENYEVAVTGFDPKEVFELDQDTVLVIEASSGLPMAKGPPRRRVWTVRTGELQKLLPPAATGSGRRA